MTDSTKEPQYQICVDLAQKSGLTSLGLMTNQAWNDDPRRLAFTLSRYKFVSKMLSGCSHVLEIGCADAFATRVVQQEVGRLTAIDFDPVFVQDVHNRMDERWKFDCFTHDILHGPVPGAPYDGAFSLDVLEHIPAQDERDYMANACASLGPNGVLILGMPSLQSQQYASPPSKAGHVNCKDAPELKALALDYFHNAFSFSMNDEVVHTGYHPMAHYLLVLCCGKK